MGRPWLGWSRAKAWGYREALEMFSLGRTRLDGTGGGGTGWVTSRVSEEEVWRKSSRSVCWVPSGFESLPWKNFFIRRLRLEESFSIVKVGFDRREV